MSNWHSIQRLDKVLPKLDLNPIVMMGVLGEVLESVGDKSSRCDILN